MESWSPKLKMLSILATTCVFLTHSSQEGCPDEKPEKADHDLRKIIEHLLDSAIPLPEYWQLLFAPTGAIQEIAMANGWHDSYMKLSTEFDSLVYLLKKNT